MLVNRLRTACVLCLILVLLSIVPAYGVSVQSRYTDSYFSTVSALFVYTDDWQAFESTWAETKQILAEIQSAVSLAEPESDLSRFNALASGESCAVSPVTAAICRIAMEAYRDTAGLYDPTVYPLVDLWGFSPRFNSNIYELVQPYDRAYVDGRLPLPEERYIEALRQLVGFDGIMLSGSDAQGWTLTKNTPSVTLDGHTFHAQLDLGGIAKGYACDLVKQLLQDKGFANGHFVCGGSSIAVLSRPDGDYQLTIGKPRPGDNDGTVFATLCARDTTLSTSSDASHTYVRDGVVYCHLIDPRTGWPVNMPAEGEKQRGIACATLLSPGAARSDALTTALCVMGPENAIAYINQHLREYPVVMALYEAGQPFCEVVTNMTQDGCIIEDTAYLPASQISGDGSIIYTGTLFAAEANEGYHEQEP